MGAGVSGLQGISSERCFQFVDIFHYQAGRVTALIKFLYALRDNRCISNQIINGLDQEVVGDVATQIRLPIRALSELKDAAINVNRPEFAFFMLPYSP